MNKKIISLFLIALTCATNAVKAIPPLHEAVAKNDPIKIEALFLTQSIDVDARYQNCTALYCAALHGRHECMQILIANGADINNKSNFLRRTPLHAAAGEGHIACVEELAQNWTIEIDAQDSNEWTPLHWAAWHGNVECIKILVQYGASVFALTRNSETPEDLARKNGHQKVVNTFHKKRRIMT